MWILWLLLTVNGHQDATSLHVYPTEALCQEAQVYVLGEMQKAYPGDTTLRVLCRPQAI
jgi:hypothetical protein